MLAATQLQAMSSAVDDEFSSFMSAAPAAGAGQSSAELLMGGGGEAAGPESGSFLPSQLFDADQSLFSANKRDEGNHLTYVHLQKVYFFYFRRSECPEGLPPISIPFDK